MRVSRVIELLSALPMDEDIAINWLERNDVEEHFDGVVLTDTDWRRIMEMWHDVQDSEIGEMMNQVSQMLAFE